MSKQEIQISREYFDEIDEHLMKDNKPSEYITSLSKKNEFQGYPFEFLWKLKSTEQSEKYHPEGSVWNHTMLVLDEAAIVREQSKDPKAFMWATLLHDIGKPSTTRIRKGKITSYDHDVAGEKLCIEFLKAFTLEEEFVRKVSSLVRYHMHMLYILKGLPHGDTKGLIKDVDANDIALLCRCDRMGRTGVDREFEDTQYREFYLRLQQMGTLAGKNY